MSIEESLASQLAQQDIPQEWKARSYVEDGVTTTTTGPTEPVATDEDLLRQFGYDPEKIELVGAIRQWRKERPDGSYLVSYNFGHRARATALDLPSLYAAARRKPRASKKLTTSDRVTVVCLSDAQIGKVDSRGGTPELLDRLKDKREKLRDHLAKVKPSRTVLAEAGDLFENFESGGNPMFTNDLSLSQQMDMAGTEVYEFLNEMQPYGHVDVMAVTSNHTAWRRGKQELGRPADDLGLFVHKQVRKLAEAAGIDAEWHIPGDYEESVVINVLGTRLGMVHGNQFGPGAAPLWWGKQMHGGQPIGSADILVTGHYHTLSIQPSGRNPYTGRSKYWVQAPTLDNGSTWYRNKAGEDSDPGLLVFDITEHGFDLQSLAVL